MARKSRLTRRQLKARKEAMQVAGVITGVVIALPFVLLPFMAWGDSLADTHYTGLAIKALVSLFI